MATISSADHIKSWNSTVSLVEMVYIYHLFVCLNLLAYTKLTFIFDKKIKLVF